MKILLLFVALSGFSFPSFAQDTIVVVEKSIKMAGSSPATEYYGFAEGDKLIFTLSLEKGELKDVAITEYPSNVIFQDHGIERIDKKVFTIPRMGVYRFEFFNSFILARTVNLKIQRIPKGEATKSFN
ncbi:MAG: hypothetical protein ABUT20_64705, partial [Bacteroidota bacterium]